jgi:transcription elongation factor Elf1
MSDDKVKKVEYTCLKCGETDAIKVFVDDPTTPPVMINCWSCHAGLNVAMDVMIQNGAGMAPSAAPSPAVMH